MYSLMTEKRWKSEVWSLVSSVSFMRSYASVSVLQRPWPIDELGESVASYMTRAAEKLRRQQCVCEAIQVFVQTNRFKETDRQYSNSI